jgi:hypothetical protein
MKTKNMGCILEKPLNDKREDLKILFFVFA